MFHDAGRLNKESWNLYEGNEISIHEQVGLCDSWKYHYDVPWNCLLI